MSDIQVNELLIGQRETEREREVFWREEEKQKNIFSFYDMCIFANFDEQKHIHFKWFLTKERPAPSNTPSSRDDTLLSHVITTATTPKFMQARLDNNQILQPGIQVC